MSSSVHFDNKGKDILILGEGPTQGLDDTTLTAEAKYPINFTESGKRFVLSLHYNGSNSFLFVNATKVYQFKAKISEIKDYAQCLGNTSRDFTINNMKKKTGLKGIVNFFSVDFILVYTNNILDIYKHLRKRKQYKIVFVLIKKIFIRLLTGMVTESSHTKYLSLRNETCMIQPTLINLHPKE